MALLPGLPDPDVASAALLNAFFVYLRSGKLGAAAEASTQAVDVASGVTPHHRLGACWQLILASVTGRWDQVRARAAEAERVGAANLATATPCILNVSVLLNCAVAGALAGDEDEARRLEAKAYGLGMEGAGGIRAGWSRLTSAWPWPWPGTGPASSRNSPRTGWTGAGSRHRPSWTPSPRSATATASKQKHRTGCRRAPFAEPFALRALGIARDDPALLGQALELLEAMELSWHAEQTGRLL